MRRLTQIAFVVTGLALVAAPLRVVYRFGPWLTPWDYVLIWLPLVAFAVFTVKERRDGTS